MIGIGMCCVELLWNSTDCIQDCVRDMGNRMKRFNDYN